MSEKHKPTLGDVMAALTSLKAGQETIRGDMATRAALIELRTEVMARMGGLENKITAIRDDIAVNHGTADQVRKANDNTREELRSLGKLFTLWNARSSVCGPMLTS